MTAIAAAAGAGIALALCLIRLFAGPTLYDRTLAANGVVTKLAIVCAAASVLAGRTEFVDAAIAFVFALLVVNVAVLKFFKARTFQSPLVRAEEL